MKKTIDHRDGDFEAFVLSAVSAETTTAAPQQHPSVEALAESVSGVGELSRNVDVRAHLAICGLCRERALILIESMALQEATLAELQQEAIEKARTRTTSTVLKASNWVWQIAESIREAMTARNVLALSGAAALCVCLAVLLPPALSYWSAEETTPIGSFGQGTQGGAQAGSADWRRMEPEDLAPMLNAVAGESPWYTTAVSLGILGTLGFPYEALPSFSAVTVYEVKEGDTWQSLSEQSLDEASLWPIVMLLNADRILRSELPPPGTEILLPDP